MNDKAIDIFRQNGGQLRMSEAIRMGISRTKLYSLRDQGLLLMLSRGVYRLSDLPEVSNLDLVLVSSRYPKAVICLISALSFHNITTTIPIEVSFALPRKSRQHQLDYPPIKVHQFSDSSYESGIEVHNIDGVDVQVYCMEKTLADCFKYRNKIGLDVTLEALKMYKGREKFNVNKIFKYAQICRVSKVMMPYLEASL